MNVSSHELHDDNTERSSNVNSKEGAEEGVRDEYSEKLEGSLKDLSSIHNNSDSSRSSSPSHSPRSSNSSRSLQNGASFEAHPTKSDKSASKLGIEEPSETVERHAVVAAATSSHLTDELHSDAPPLSVNEVTLVGNREELVDLLELNGKLRMQLLGSKRQEKHMGLSGNSLFTSSGSTTARRNQPGEATWFQQSMRHVLIRNDLRREKEELLQLRRDLQRKLANKKRLHSFLAINEQYRADISKLQVLKRSLLLEIRQNERILLNSENMGSEQAHKRLIEEMRASEVLAQRSLKKAQDDASEVMRTHLDVQLRVKKLEQEIESAERQDSSHVFSAELLQIHEMYQQKAQTILALRKKLRQIKSRSPSEGQPRSVEGQPRSVEGVGMSAREKRERERLTKRIREMRAEIQFLSSKCTRPLSAESNSSLCRSSSYIAGGARTSIPTTERCVSETDSRPLSLPEGARQEHKSHVESSSTPKRNDSSITEEQAPLNKPSGAHRDSLGGALDELKLRLEQKRERNNSQLSQEQTASTEMEVHNAAMATQGESLSKDAPIPPPSCIEEPNFLREDYDHTAEANTGMMPVSAGKTEESTSREQEKSTVPAWFDDEDDADAKLPEQEESSPGQGENKLTEGNGDDVMEEDPQKALQENNNQLKNVDAHADSVGGFLPDDEAKSNAYSEAESNAHDEAKSNAYSEAESNAHDEAKSNAYSEVECNAHSEAESNAQKKVEVEAEAHDANPSWLDFN